MKTFCGALLAVTAGLSLMCAPPQEDAIVLADLIAQAAMSLRRVEEPSVRTVEYQFKRDASLLVALTPTTGLEPASLPRDASEAQRANMRDAVSMWPNQEVLAVTWSDGTSSGPEIDRHVDIPKQLAIVKPPRGRITVVLRREGDGRIVVSELR